ncbi:hypothetical protein SK128_025980, partial [Halocaridina rubra]
MPLVGGIIGRILEDRCDFTNAPGYWVVRWHCFATGGTFSSGVGEKQDHLPVPLYLLPTCEQGMREGGTLSLLSSHPHAEVPSIGDFNVHCTEWLHSSYTDIGG